MTTSLQSDITHKQPERDAIDAQLNDWLSKGNVIQKLSTTPVRHGGEYNSRSFDFTERKK